MRLAKSSSKTGALDDFIEASRIGKAMALPLKTCFNIKGIHGLAAPCHKLHHQQFIVPLCPWHLA
jgi:hypothetical protein